MNKSHWGLAALGDIDGMADFVGRADHVDVVDVRGTATLREFVAVFLGRRPVWLRLLYQLRAGLARVLGLGHDDAGMDLGCVPADVPMEPGATLSFFTVLAAAEDRHWLAVAKDKHLQAVIAILAEPLATGGSRFAVVTVVAYHNWIGPVYFNIIRPFHSLVVGRMAALAAGNDAKREGAKP